MVRVRAAGGVSTALATGTASSDGCDGGRDCLVPLPLLLHPRCATAAAPCGSLPSARRPARPPARPPSRPPACPPAFLTCVGYHERRCNESLTLARELATTRGGGRRVPQPGGCWWRQAKGWEGERWVAAAGFGGARGRRLWRLPALGGRRVMMARLGGGAGGHYFVFWQRRQRHTAERTTEASRWSQASVCTSLGLPKTRRVAGGEQRLGTGARGADVAVAT